MATLSKFKWFWAWQDEKEEDWLREMAKEGLHLQSLGFPGKYTFKVGEPRNDYYRMDFITDRKDYQNYLQLFKDAGWEHIGEMGGWQYFRTSAKEAAIPEIFTDKSSKVRKYQRVSAALILFLPISIFLMIQPTGRSNEAAGFFLVGKTIGIILIFLCFAAMVKIARRVQQLKDK